jgi:FKBP-type peptidyl-prolyl cis-trans isomerase
MRIRYITIAIMILFFGKISAQNKGLAVGDKMPDFLIPKMIHTTKGKVRTSDFKNKLLIIDFWSTSCSGCVEALPKMEALQKRFVDKIKILPVTYETEAYTFNFWKNNKYTKNLLLPSVVEDKIFSAYFKHKTIPHEIWVNKGKVVAITSSQYVDVKNIKEVLEGKVINWPVKYDYYTFDGDKALLFKLDDKQIDINNTSLKYAAISDYKEGVSSEGFSGGSGIVRDTLKKTIRAYFLNQPIYNSYILNLNNTIDQGSLVKPSITVDPNQIIWEVIDKSKYVYDPKLDYEQNWVRDHGICFESLNPDTGQTDRKIYKTITSDLNRLLGLNVRWEKRKEKVYVLVRTDNKKNPTGEGNDSGTKTISIGNLIYNLNQKEANPYVFDESNYTGNERVKIADSISWTNILSIKKYLLNQGLDLKEEERNVDKLIFTEVGNNQLIVDGKSMNEIKRRKLLQTQLKDVLPEENKLFLEINKKKKGVITLASGLQYKVLKMGSGPKPKLNDRVKVNYTGTFVNGKIFESSLENGIYAEFGVQEVIKGWTEALLQMPVGSKWILYIPSNLAYGDHTAQGTVPPNSTLIFELELLNIKS